jgi:hypothetical protein
MKVEVAVAIEELGRQFAGSSLGVREDGQGGAFVVMDRVSLGPRFRPDSSWVGFQIPAQYPYADIYPIFIAEDVSRVDGVAFVAPVTRGHTFEGRPAIQISRRNGAAQSEMQKATAKLLKVLNYLENLP